MHAIVQATKEELEAETEVVFIKRYFFMFGRHFCSHVNDIIFFTLSGCFLQCAVNELLFVWKVYRSDL